MRPPKPEEVVRPGSFEVAAPLVVLVACSFAVVVVLAAAFVDCAVELVRLAGLLAPEVSVKAGKAESAAIILGIEINVVRTKDEKRNEVRLSSRILACRQCSQVG